MDPKHITRTSFCNKEIDNVTNNDGVSIGSSTLYLDGIKVGDGGQTTGRLNLTVFI